MKKTLNRNKDKKSILSPLSISLLVILILYTASLFGLLAWGFLSTFKDFVGDFRLNDGFTLPKKFVFTYYSYFINDFNIAVHGGTKLIYLEEMFHNSAVYALGCAFFQTLVPCVTAYVVARYKFKFLNLYYFIVIATMAIPIVGSTASEMQVAYSLGLMDQLWGLWIMKANFLGLYFLIFHSTFKGLPEAYSEAAKIDGAGNFSIMLKIMFPLIKNTFLTVFLIYFIQFWNDYQTPFLYLNNRPTLFYAVYWNMQSSGAQEIANICGKMALAYIGLIPTTIIFLIFHKKLLGSITVGGIK